MSQGVRGCSDHTTAVQSRGYRARACQEMKERKRKEKRRREEGREVGKGKARREGKPCRVGS